MKNPITTYAIPIPDHPVTSLRKDVQMQYVLGVGEFLCYLFRKYDSHNYKKAKSLFLLWTNSFSIDLPDNYWQFTWNLEHTRRVVAKDYFHFSLSRVFVFDCFYIASYVDKDVIEKVYICFKQLLIRPKIVEQTYKHWKRGKLRNLPPQLISHRKSIDKLLQNGIKKILVVATMTAGKSTLINALVGYRINRVKTTACTSKLCYIYNKLDSTSEIQIKQRKGAYKLYRHIDEINKDDFSEICLHYNSSLSKTSICLIDTPGANYSGNLKHREITYNAIKSNDYDAIIYIINCTSFNTDDDANLRRFTMENTSKPIIFVINKLDCLSPDDDSIPKFFDKLVEASNGEISKTNIVPMSAEYAFLLRIGAKSFSSYEKMRYSHLSNLFKLEYFDLKEYYQGSKLSQRKNNELSKSGITILEHLLQNI